MSEQKLTLTERSYGCKFCQNKSRMILLATSQDVVKEIYAPVKNSQTNQVVRSELVTIYTQYQIAQCTNSECENINVLQFEYFESDSFYPDDPYNPYRLKAIYRLSTQEAEIDSSSLRLELPIARRFIEEFVQDAETKEYLLSDFKELLDAFKSGAYKSTVILCGSILECLAVDTLLQEESKANEIYNKIFPKDVKPSEVSQWDLYKLIKICGEMGIIGPDGKDLALKIKDYRNLVHINKWKKTGLNTKESTAALMIQYLKIILEDIMEWYSNRASNS